MIKILTDDGERDGYTKDATSRPDTAAILRGTLFRSWKVFTSLDKKADVKDIEPITLLYDACWDSAGDGIMNCSKTCGNKATLFSSWKTLWHCLSLASLSLAPTTFPSLNDSSNALIRDSLLEVGITNATGFDGMRVLDYTFECAAASCRDKSMGNCSIHRPGSGYIDDDKVSWIMMHEALELVCGDLESELNIDIAGPGVLIAYITQTAMVLYAWLFFLFLKVNKIINTFTSVLTHLFRKRNPGPKLLSHRASGLERLERTNLAHATSTFLAELHEAQCFFIVAIGIALLTANSRAAIFTGAENWQSLLWNRDSIQVTAGLGAWPVVLGQVTLRRARLDSVYYLLLSTVALILAGAAADTAANPNPDKVYESFRNQNIMAECGGNPSLRTFCVENRFGIYWNPLPAASVYAFLGFLGILWWAELWKRMRATAWFPKRDKCLPKRALKLYNRTRCMLPKVATILMHAAEAGGLTCIAFGLAQIRVPLVALLIQGDTGTWSVGQLVAVLIWAPVISKYLHLVILGVEKGFKLRLSQAFEIVKRAQTCLQDTT